MATVLVTGASGAVGAYLARRLLLDGHHVVSIAHDEHPFDVAGLIGIKSDITWVRGSILDLTLCKRIVADYAVNAIFHLAALPLVQVGTRTTVPVFSTNVMGTVNLLEAVKENNWAGKPIRFIYMSTDKAYGDAGARPYTEDMALNGLAVYDASKACADLITRCYAKSGLAPAVAVIRSCNLIAPGDLNLGRVFPRTIIPAIRSESPVIYKTDYLREFMYVEDGVEGILAVDKGLQEDRDLFNGQAFNTGSGEQRTLEQTVEEILRHFPGVVPKWVNPPSLTRVEIPFQKLDTNKINRLTGWKAKTNFAETVNRLVNWWKAHWYEVPSYVRTWRTDGWHE